MKFMSRVIGLWSGCLMTLALAPVQAGDAQKGKEVFKSTSDGVALVNPAAGAVIKVVGEFLDLTGYFGNAADPVGDAIKVINQRLDALEARTTVLENAVNSLTKEVRRDENLARVRRLRDHHDRLALVIQALTQRPTDKGMQQQLVKQTQQVAADLKLDTDLWLWSDLVLKDTVWDGKAVKVGDYLDPDFKPWLAMEDYALSLLTWMTAIEYATDGNAQAVMQNYGRELQSHIDFLSVRPGWNELSDEAATLPENIKKRINGSFGADKYPDKRNCYFHEFTQDEIAREVRDITTRSYPTQMDNVLCTVPQGFLNQVHTESEEALESEYGTQLMAALAAKLTRLKNYGSIREQFVGTFGATPANFQALMIYGIRSNGDLLWYRKDGTAAAWQGPKKVGTGWGGFKDVIAAGGNSFYALTNDGKLVWYRHDGFMDGSASWSPPVEVGSGWIFSRIFSGGEGIVYAITNDGRLLWYRNNGADHGIRSWQPVKVVGAGWNEFKFVFSTGLGAIYAVRNDGHLSLYRHDGYATGDAKWQPERIIGAGWNSFQRIVPGSDGVILAILPSGKLLWYKDVGRNAVMALGRVKVTGPQPPPDPSRAMLSICDIAREARGRGSPAAPGLETQCRAFQATFVAVDAQTLATLQAKGPAIANADPLFAELRNRVAVGPARRGFDIGMAAAEGNTAPGPGKQRIHNSLLNDERAGFDIAVAFSLERNRNADLAARGAAVAKVDTRVADNRTADPDVFYWLGFDIATGLFGDAKLGALGHTAMGPGAEGIRNALSAAGQRGFVAAVTLYLGASANGTPSANPSAAFTAAGKNPDRAAATIMGQVIPSSLPTLDTGDGPIEIGASWQDFGKVFALIPDPASVVR